MWSFAQVGPRRRRRRRVPAPPPRRPAAGQGDGDARRGRDRRRGGRPRARVPVRRRRRVAAARGATRSRARLAAGPTRSLGLSKRLLNAIVRDRPRRLARARRALPGARDDVARPRRRDGRVPARSATRSFDGTVSDCRACSGSRRTTCASTTQSRLLLCRLTDITERPAAWTLPGGGIEFGEHPEARRCASSTRRPGSAAASASCSRRLGPPGRCRTSEGATIDYHSIRFIYRTEIVGGELRDEIDESTDRAAVVHAANELAAIRSRRRRRMLGARVRVRP